MQNIIQSENDLRAEIAIQNQMIDGARRAASKLMLENEQLRDALRGLLEYARFTASNGYVNLEMKAAKKALDMNRSGSYSGLSPISAGKFEPGEY